MLRHLINLLLAWMPPSRWFALRRRALIVAGVDMGEGVCVCGGGWIYGPGRLRIGHRSWLSPRVVIYTHADADIRIGDRCDIGPGVHFITGSHVIGTGSRRAGEGWAKAINIGNGCWIRADSRILGGVEIGDGAVVAAGAVVTKDVPPHSLVAGVPAVVKRELTP